MTVRGRFLACCSLLALLLAGCATPAPVDYLILETPAQALIRRDAAMVSVGPIDLPDYLKRSGLARRDADGALHYSAMELWAEPLDRGLQRVLVHTLSDALGDTPVSVFPGMASTGARYRVSVSLRRLDVTDTGVVMEASWQFLATPTPAAQRVSAGRFSEDRDLASTDGPAVARAVSSLVQALGREIAIALPARES